MQVILHEEFSRYIRKANKNCSNESISSSYCLLTYTLFIHPEFKFKIKTLISLNRFNWDKKNLREENEKYYY